MEAFGASCLFQSTVDLGQQAGTGLAIGKEVAVIGNVDGNTKPLLQIWAKRRGATECGEIREITDDTLTIVSRTGESKTNGSGRCGQRFAYALKSTDKGTQTFM